MFIFEKTNFEQQLVNRDYREGEFEFLEEGENKKWLKVSVSPVTNEQNRITHYITIREDITERKKIERSLEREKRKAKKLADMSGKFLSNMSHEIRTPLNGIIGLINILKNENPRSDQDEYLKLLSFTSDHLLSLINNVLDLNKINKGRLELENKDIDFKMMLQSIVGTYEAKVLEKGIKLILDFPEDLHNYYLLDKVRITQIFTNLLNNAIKFTHDGFVKISVKSVDKQEDCSILNICIEDSGIGIPKSKLNQIFQRFAHANVSTVRKYGGSGLGLAITKKLLDLMGSRINVQSEVGKGSKFSFDLKLRNGDGKDDLRSISNVFEKNDLFSFKALSVDDNSVNQLIIEKYINSLGGIVERAGDGYEALKMIKDKSYDIVFMDIQMPKINGIKTTRRIRNLSDPYFSNVPIIAVSASAEQSLRKTTLSCGMNQYLTKPYHIEELRSIVLRFVKDNAQNKKGLLKQNSKIQNEQSLSFINAQLDAYSLGDVEFRLKFVHSLMCALDEFRKDFIKSIHTKNLVLLRSSHHKVKSSLIILKQDQTNEKIEMIKKKLAVGNNANSRSVSDIVLLIDNLHAVCSDIQAESTVSVAS